LFILFCSPPGAAYDFPTDGLEEIGRVAFSWLSRVWRLLSDVGPVPLDADLQRSVHKAVKAVTEDFETFSFNTAIARLMELLNAFSKAGPPVPREGAETFLKLLAPIAPFITEELWHQDGHESSIHKQPWPTYDEALVREERTTMVIQVNGRVRDTVEVPVTISPEEMQALALDREKVVALLDGKVPTKIITVPPRLVNLVVV
jgi:leucyl-tRNA synthetase